MYHYVLFTQNFVSPKSLGTSVSEGNFLIIRIMILFKILGLLDPNPNFYIQDKIDRSRAHNWFSQEVTVNKLQQHRKKSKNTGLRCHDP